MEKDTFTGRKTLAVMQNNRLLPGLSQHECRWDFIWIDVISHVILRILRIRIRQAPPSTRLHCQRFRKQPFVRPFFFQNSHLSPISVFRLFLPLFLALRLSPVLLSHFFYSHSHLHSYRPQKTPRHLSYFSFHFYALNLSQSHTNLLCFRLQELTQCCTRDITWCHAMSRDVSFNEFLSCTIVLGKCSWILFR